MEIIPLVHMKRFEQLEPGDLFLYKDHRHTFYALKTQPPPSGDRSCMVLLGPSFLENANESFLLPWQGASVLSLGKEFSVLLPTDTAAWSWTGPSRDPVCLAVTEEDGFICTNGGMSPSHYFACFVNVKTGAIVEQRLQGAALFTTTWEIVVPGPNHSPRSVLKFPLATDH